MDEYTKNTKQWLDSRYKSTDENGVYKSHAAIYGFSRDLLSLGLYKNNYAIIKEIEKVSAEYQIINFLEVGCAEGYTSHLIRKLFKFDVYVSDLSTEAVKRAKEIYGLNGFVSDVQNLSNIKNNSFDLVLCSETIEHVPDQEKAFQELKRITKKVLIITVPAAKNLKEKIEYLPPKGPCTHLNIFTKEELKNLADGSKVKGISINWLTKIETFLTDNNKKEIYSSAKYLLINKLLNILFTPLRKVYCAFLAKIFIKLDYCLNKIMVSKVFTYMVTYKKRSQESYLNRQPPPKNIMNYILKGSKVEQYFLDV